MLPNSAATPAPAFVSTITAATFEREVLQKSLETPVLLDFWATWCGPCKQLGPILEKLAQDYNGAFVLAKVDVDKEQQLAGQFGIRSIPTVILVKDGQLVDGFPGALPEGQLRQFLAQHGIVPAVATEPEVPAEVVPPTPAEEAARLRRELEAKPEDGALKLDLALALARSGETDEAAHLIATLPANLGTDARARIANVLIANPVHLREAPARTELEHRIATNPDDLAARHLLGLRLLGDGDAEAALSQFLEMLRRNRDFDGGLPRKALIEAFEVIQDTALVGRFRRDMSALLF